MAYSTTPTAKATLTLTTSGMSSSDTSINTTMDLHDVAHKLGCTRSTGLKRANGTDNSNAGILVFDTDSYSAATAATTRGRGY